MKMLVTLLITNLLLTASWMLSRPFWSGVKQRASVFTLHASLSSNSYLLSQQLQGTCLYLVGMMGCGKTTVGGLLAEQLSYKFLDTDEIAEYMIEMPIAQFFDEGGEQTFRDLEYRILMETAQYRSVVMSTGGGIVLKSENWGLLRHGIVVFIDVPPEDIYDRLCLHDDDQFSKRPLLRSADPLAKLQELRTEREDKYLQADVHVCVPGSASAEEVSNRVVEAVLSFIKENPPLWKTWKANGNQEPASGQQLQQPRLMR
jgi:shikimate kinase